MGWGPGVPSRRAKVVGPGAANVSPPAGLLASIPANVLAPVSPAHDVAHGARLLDGQLARPWATQLGQGLACREKCTMLIPLKNPV